MLKSPQRRAFRNQNKAANALRCDTLIMLDNKRLEKWISVILAKRFR